jgi:hypothetical protein
VEEPQLRGDQRTGEERRGDDAERHCNERDERHEPDGVLRRQEPSEGEEHGHRRRCGGDEALSSAVTAGEQPRDEDDRDQLHDARGNCERIGHRAGQVPGERERRPTHDLGLVDAEPVRSQEQSSSQALDLQRPPRLRVHALPEPVPPHDRERADDQKDDARECEHRPGETTPADGDAEGRQERSRIDLGRDRKPEQPEGQRRALVEQRAERGGDEERRPDVVCVERDGPEREGRERQGRKRAVEAARARAQPHEDERRHDDRRHAEDGHQHLERVAVSLLGQQRRRREDREGPRRVLDEDVPVRDSSVQQAARVLAVEADIAILAAAEEAALGHSGGNEVQRRYERGCPEGRSQLGPASRRRRSPACTRRCSRSRTRRCRTSATWAPSAAVGTRSARGARSRSV